MTAEPVRLSELVATLSLVSDLGMGRPVERVLRQTVIAMRLADLAGVAPEVSAATYYTSLLTWVACATDTSEIAQLFGDEATFYADSHDDDLAGVTMAVFVARHLGHGSSRLRRVGMVGKFLATAGRSVQQVMESHCQSASEFACRLDLGDEVSTPLVQAFERWDGKGVPGRVGQTKVALATRLVQLADSIEAFHHTGGVDAAIEVATSRRGTQFDPDLVDQFCAQPSAVLDGLDTFQAWDQVIALDPRLGQVLTDEQLDGALYALGDFSDLKSPFRLGHSRGVAELVGDAAVTMGMPAAEVANLRRAGAIHDIGMVGVTSAIWDAAGPWSPAQEERARTHPYFTGRMFARVAPLAPVVACASQHHERLDGSGYPHGLSANALAMPARLLAVADVYHALREPRPHRPAFSSAETEATLHDEVRAGRLDGDAVGAVLTAAGHRVRKRAALPAGLTRREVDVLVLLARGRSNSEIATELTISRKTVSSHLEHIYTKLGVTKRTEAALFAMQNGLVEPLTP
jgi:HD-GYP domain-containing protein (c-di-GMP phosphodiesterase class II)